MATQVKVCRLSFQVAVFINPQVAVYLLQEQVVIRLTPAAQAIINRMENPNDNSYNQEQEHQPQEWDQDQE